MCRFVALAIAGILAGSSSAIAVPSSDNATWVVVLEKQSGMRDVHSQSITRDRGHAMQQLFRSGSMSPTATTLSVSLAKTRLR
jgi:hypothetical protein